MSNREPTAEEIEAIKQDMMSKREAAEQAAYAYFCALPIGNERIRAHDVYQNIRLATRL
jgi:hypothetical protein